MTRTADTRSETDVSGEGAYAPAFSWTAAPDLMARLAHAQNHPANIMVDIMTFAGMCDSRDELERHVAYYETRAAEYIAPKRRRKAA